MFKTFKETQINEKKDPIGIEFTGRNVKTGEISTVVIDVDENKFSALNKALEKSGIKFEIALPF